MPGAQGGHAKEKVLEERPDLKTVEIIQWYGTGEPKTRERRQDRVLIYVDADGVVVRTPTVG